MKYKTFIPLCAVGMVSLLGCQNVETNAEERSETLVLTSFLPPMHSQNTDVLSAFIEEVEAATDGRVSIDVYYGDSLGAADYQYDMAVTGTSDFALGMHGYTPGVFPLTEVVELPNIAQSAEESTAILQHLLEEYPEIEEEHEGTNIAWLFSVEPYQILTSNTKVENPEDLEGLKIRSPSSIANEILESLGAIPVSMPFGEVYESMQRGVIDGAYAPASVMKNYQTNEVTNYIARGDFSTANHFVVYNEDSLNALQDEDREAIENILADDWGMVAGKTYDKDEVDAWQIAEDDGIEVVHVRDNHWQVWEEAMSEVSQQWIERANALGAPGNQMYEELLNLDDD